LEVIIIIIMQHLTRHVSVIRMTNRTRDYDLMALYKSVYYYYYYYYYYYLRFHNKNIKIGFLTELLKNYRGRCVISMLAMGFVQTHITQ